MSLENLAEKIASAAKSEADEVIKAANEHCGIPEDVYIDPHYPEETVDIKRLRQHIWLSRTPAIFNYENDKEIFESFD